MDKINWANSRGQELKTKQTQLRVWPQPSLNWAIRTSKLRRPIWNQLDGSQSVDWEDLRGERVWREAVLQSPALQNNHFNIYFIPKITAKHLKFWSRPDLPYIAEACKSLPPSIPPFMTIFSSPPAAEALILQLRPCVLKEGWTKVYCSVFIYCSNALQTVFRGYLSASIKLVYAAPQRLPLSLRISWGSWVQWRCLGPQGNRVKDLRVFLP